MINKITGSFFNHLILSRHRNTNQFSNTKGNCGSTQTKNNLPKSREPNAFSGEKRND
jgi:hypothetical protein